MAERRSPDSAIRVALLYPELLGTYGDRGNARVLVQRLAWRGVPVELVEASWGEPAPAACDVYVLGVCAGFQILGHSFFGPDGAARAGLGLIDATTARRAQPRIVGEILVQPDPEVGLPALSGYENHAGLTDLGPAATPLGRVDAGVGNGDGTEGALQGHVVGTYLHGPVLARNPALADLILSWFAGELEPLDDSEVADLREERRAFVAAETARRQGRRKLGDAPFGWRSYRRRRMSSTARPSPANLSV